MISPDSKKFYFTLTVEEAAACSSSAAYQQLAAAQVIRNRLREWQQAAQLRPLDRQWRNRSSSSLLPFLAVRQVKSGSL